MKLHCDAQQTCQLDAIRAVVELFAGQPAAAGTFEWQANLLEPELLDSLGVANGLALTDARLLAAKPTGPGRNAQCVAQRRSRWCFRFRPDLIGITKFRGFI